MTHKPLLAAAAAVSLLALSSGAQAGECLRGDRMEARVAAAVDDTGRMVRRVGDGIVRVGDRMFGWVHRRPRA